jgi:hypothetical protein
MNRVELEAIKARIANMKNGPKSAQMVIVCARAGVPIHPDELGADDSLAFQQRVEATASAIADRAALLAWIEADFEMPEGW